MGQCPARDARFVAALCGHYVARTVALSTVQAPAMRRPMLAHSAPKRAMAAVLQGLPAQRTLAGVARKGGIGRPRYRLW